MIYLIDLALDDNGTFLIGSATFPELTSFAGTKAKAAVQGVRALEEAIAARINDGDHIPSPASAAELKRFQARRGNRLALKLPLLTTLKVGLYNALQRKGITRAELARRLGWHREQVDRLFRLDHKSRLEQIEAAFAALDQDVEVRVREVA